MATARAEELAHTHTHMRGEKGNGGHGHGVLRGSSAWGAVSSGRGALCAREGKPSDGRLLERHNDGRPWHGGLTKVAREGSATAMVQHGT